MIWTVYKHCCVMIPTWFFWSRMLKAPPLLWWCRMICKDLQVWASRYLLRHLDSGLHHNLRSLFIEMTPIVANLSLVSKFQSIVNDKQSPGFWNRSHIVQWWSSFLGLASFSISKPIQLRWAQWFYFYKMSEANQLWLHHCLFIIYSDIPSATTCNSTVQTCHDHDHAG